MFQSAQRIFVVFFLSVPLVDAALLPNPTNVSLDGNILTWDRVDDSTGYNIYLNFRYFDTVRDSTQYGVTQPGRYWVVAFDDNGNFGQTYGRELAVEYSGSGDNISVTENYYTSIVQTTCLDVGPGESCIANCGSVSTHTNPPKTPRYMSGGGCATSDIVEADAFIGQYTYQCTVPTYSGEVIATAICVNNP